MGQRVLVVGATGTQGGAVASALLDRGVSVHALTRRPESTPARRLAERGATVVEGDLRKPPTLRRAVEDVDAVFCVTDYWEAGFDGEVTQGMNLANVAASVGVDHFVFSSVAGADRTADAPMLESKARVEHHLDGVDPTTTVLRPSYFLQNFELRREDIADGTLALPLAPDTRLPVCDVADVGRFAARVFADPDHYVGETVALAGDTLTLGEMAAAFESGLGHEVSPVHVPLARAREAVGPDYARLFAWYNDGDPPDIPTRLEREYGFTPTTFGDYLAAADWTRPALTDGTEPERAQ